MRSWALQISPKSTVGTHFTLLSLAIILGKTGPLLLNRCTFLFLIMPKNFFATSPFNKELTIIAETSNYRYQYCFPLWRRELKSALKTNKINRLTFVL